MGEFHAAKTSTSPRDRICWRHPGPSLFCIMNFLYELLRSIGLTAPFSKRMFVLSTDELTARYGSEQVSRTQQFSPWKRSSGLMPCHESDGPIVNLQSRSPNRELNNLVLDVMEILSTVQ